MKYLLFLLVLWAFPVRAEIIKTTPSECRFLTAHQPDSDVAYKPGVDVRGKPVVSADINASNFELPDVVQVPLSVDLIERIRDTADQFPGVMVEVDYGILEIHRDGRILYDGQDWTQPVYAACGHEAGNAISSDPVTKTAIPDVPAKPKTKPSPPPENVLLEGGESRDEGYR